MGTEEQKVCFYCVPPIARAPFYRVKETRSNEPRWICSRCVCSKEGCTRPRYIVEDRLVRLCAEHGESYRRARREREEREWKKREAEREAERKAEEAAALAQKKADKAQWRALPEDERQAIRAHRKGLMWREWVEGKQKTLLGDRLERAAHGDQTQIRHLLLSIERHSHLSQREVAALKSILAGRTLKAIAQEQGYSPSRARDVVNHAWRVFARPPHQTFRPPKCFADPEPPPPSPEERKKAAIERKRAKLLAQLAELENPTKKEPKKPEPASPCILCNEVPRGLDPGLVNGVCCFCGYWSIPPGPERESLRAQREKQGYVAIQYERKWGR